MFYCLWFIGLCVRNGAYSEMNLNGYFTLSKEKWNFRNMRIALLKTHSDSIRVCVELIELKCTLNLVNSINQFIIPILPENQTIRRQVLVVGICPILAWSKENAYLNEWNHVKGNAAYNLSWANISVAAAPNISCYSFKQNIILFLLVYGSSEEWNCLIPNSTCECNGVRVFIRTKK